jgi:hypothetical protein
MQFAINVSLRTADMIAWEFRCRKTPATLHSAEWIILFLREAAQ